MVVSVSALLPLPLPTVDTTTAPPPIASVLAVTTAVTTFLTVDNACNLPPIPLKNSINLFIVSLFL